MDTSIFTSMGGWFVILIIAFDHRQMPVLGMRLDHIVFVWVLI